MSTTGPGWFRSAVMAATCSVCVAIAPAAHGVHYYVAQGHPQAADDNPGSADAPLKTINAVLPHLRPGDTAVIRSGVYREQVILTGEAWTFKGTTYPPIPSGRSYAEMISVVAAPGAEVVIKGSDVVTGWAAHAGAIWVRENWPINSQQVFCDDTSLQQIAGTMVDYCQTGKRWRGRKGEGLDDLEPGSFYYDIAQQKLYVWLADGSDPNAHRIEVSVRPFLFWVRSLAYVRVSGLKMRHSNSSAVVNWAAVALSGEHHIMEDVEVAWCDYVGVSLGGRNNTLLRCRFNYNGNSGLGASGYGFRIIDCETSYNNTRRWSASWHAGGMKLIPRVHDTLISGCTAVHNIESPGIWLDGWMSNVTIRNCLCHHNGKSGIMYEIGERAVIKNNICYENGHRGIYISNSAECALLHNVCYRNAMSGITVIGVERGGGQMSDPDSGYVPARNNLVWGNILMDNCHPDLCPEGWEGRPELILPDPAIPSNRGNRSDYNLFYRSDGRAIPFGENWDITRYSDLAAWQAATGNDRHSIIAAPRFADMAGRDFRPAAGSPAIMLARPHMSMRYDYAGGPRPLREKVYFTAGPFEPPADLRGEIPPRIGEPEWRPLSLGADLPVFPTDGELGTLGRALGRLAGAEETAPSVEVRLADVPFTLPRPARALLLDGAHPTSVVPVKRPVRALHVLHAILSPGSGRQHHCAVQRQDGMTIELVWESGRNIAPSLGPWRGALADGPGPGTTRIVHDADGVRLFLTTWENENEWFPVDRLEWTLDDTSATVVILGVTVRTLR